MKKPLPASFHIAMIFALAFALVAMPESGRANDAAPVDPQYTWDLTEFYLIEGCMGNGTRAPA